MITLRHVSKKEIATDAYMNALIFFWLNSDRETETGKKCQALFEDYVDILWEIDARFEGNDFSNPESQEYVVNDLDKLYYAITDIDPSSDTLLLMCPAIDMLYDIKPTLRSTL